MKKLSNRFLLAVTTVVSLMACSAPVQPTPTAAPKPAATVAAIATVAAPTVAAPTTAPTAAPAPTVAPTIAPTALPVSAPKIVASTSWVGAFAKAAGATDITVIAPSTVQHPPDYDPKPSDLVSIAKADYIMIAGYEGFAKRMQEAVGGDAKKIITVNTENSPEAIRKEVTRLAELLKTQDKAKGWLDNFDKEYAKLSDALKAKANAAKPTIVSQVFVTPWLMFSGLQSAGCYGPAALTPAQLKTLADIKPTIVFENAHMGGGDPVVEATKAKKVMLINFPSDNLDLLDVFKANSQRIVEALNTAPASSSVAGHSHDPAPGCAPAAATDDHAAMGHGTTTTTTHAAAATGHGTATTMTHAAPAMSVTTSQAANVFAVSVAQYYLDNAGFHDMATTLSNTQKINTAYISTINRTKKMMTQTAWGPALQAQAQAFVVILGKYADALAAGNVNDVVKIAATAHDAQHDLSHAIDYWYGSKPAKAQQVDPAAVSVAQHIMDTTGFHDMATTLSNTQKIDTAYLTKLNRTKKVLTQTTWGTALDGKAQAFIVTIGKFADALAAGNVKDAVKASDMAHDEQHDLSHVIDEWYASKPAKRQDADVFAISIAQHIMDTAGFHDMATTLSNTQKIDTSHLTKINHVKKILGQTKWSAKLDPQAQEFIGTIGKFADAIAASNVKDAIKFSEAAHDQQHALSHAIDEWLINPTK